MNIIYKISILIAVAASCCSCEKWLEATSNDKIPVAQLFETREGFEDALSGVYINMGSGSLYGANATWKCNDLVAFPFVKSLKSDIVPFQSHLYTYLVVKNATTGIWEKSYNVLANINLILREIETHRDVIVNDVEYSLFKGELLALRAYLHFDLMRMFGTADWNGDNASKMAIPYTTKYSSEITPQLSYSDTEALLLADLEEAIELLRSSDPVLLTDRTDFDTSVNIDGYWNNRTKHLNYYAALALAARVYQWKNDTQTAATYAQQVIDGAFTNNIVSWVDPEAQLLASTNDGRDWTFSTEHLFSLEITSLFSELTVGYLFDISGANYGICVSNEVVDNLLYVRYDSTTGSQAGAEDIRGPSMQLRYGALGYYCYKLYGSASYPSEYRNRMPMIRISEMYYILAENYISLDQDAAALQMLDEVRKYRGIGDDFPTTVDAEAELMKEYYREFLCEGQLFYYMKHKKVESSLHSLFSVNYNHLVYNYPEEEINYGRSQEL